MGLIGNDVSTFYGVEVAKSRPRAAISSTESEHMASDLANVYQQIKGSDLGSPASALSNIDPQVHDGDAGALLRFPVGSLDGVLSIDLENAYGGDFVVTSGLVLVPAGCTELEFAAHVDWFSLGILGTGWLPGTPVPLEVRVYGSGLGLITTESLSPVDGEHRARITLTAAQASNLIVFRVYALNADHPVSELQIKHLHVTPYPWRKNDDVSHPFPASTGELETPIPQAWENIYHWMTTGTLSSLLTKRLSESTNYLIKHITGSEPVGDNPLPPIAAHDHDGGNSAAIDFALLGKFCGTLVTATNGEYGQVFSVVHGLYAPDSGSRTTYQTARLDVLRVPPRASGYRTLHLAALVYESGKSGTVQFSLSQNVDGSSPSPTPVTATASSGNFEVVTATMTMGAGDALYYLRTQIKDGTSSETYLLAVAAWLEN